MKKTGWEIACELCQVDPIYRAVQGAGDTGFGLTSPVPRDVTSREFPVWLTEQ